MTGYSGNASWDALAYHNGLKFTTIDRDNDLRSYGNCAAGSGGGFWWGDCGGCRVNGARSIGRFFWQDLPGGSYLQSTRMWLQCK